MELFRRVLKLRTWYRKSPGQVSSELFRRLLKLRSERYSEESYYYLCLEEVHVYVRRRGEGGRVGGTGLAYRCLTGSWPILPAPFGRGPRAVGVGVSSASRSGHVSRLPGAAPPAQEGCLRQTHHLSQASLAPKRFPGPPSSPAPHAGAPQRGGQGRGAPRGCGPMAPERIPPSDTWFKVHRTPG